MVNVNNIRFDDENFVDLMNQFCDQIEILHIENSTIENIARLFGSYEFQHLNKIEIRNCYCSITRIEMNLIDGFPSRLESLSIEDNQNLEIIDQDAFSKLKDLKYLSLFNNYAVAVLSFRISFQIKIS